MTKRGTMFPMRARKLFELYRAHGSMEEIPASEREAVEKTIFGSRWRGSEKTRAFLRRLIRRIWSGRSGMRSIRWRWCSGGILLSPAVGECGEGTRVVDYQVWCGPAMGAFNEWVRGSFLEEPGNRRVGVVAMNLLHGAAVMTRLNALRMQSAPWGVRMDAEMERVEPVEMGELAEGVGGGVWTGCGGMSGEFLLILHGGGKWRFLGKNTIPERLGGRELGR